MSLALLFHYLVLNMFRMLVHPSSGACDLFVELFHGLHCFLDVIRLQLIDYKPRLQLFLIVRKLWTIN